MYLYLPILFDPYRWWYMYGKKNCVSKNSVRLSLMNTCTSNKYKQQVRAVFQYTPYMYLSIGIDPVLNR